MSNQKLTIPGPGGPIGPPIPCGGWGPQLWSKGGGPLGAKRGPLGPNGGGPLNPGGGRNPPGPPRPLNLGFWPMWPLGPLWNPLFLPLN